MCPIYYSRSDRDSNLVGSSGWRRHVGGGRARAYPEEQEPPPVRCARSADRGHVAPSRPHKQQALVDRAGAFQVGRPTRQQPRLPSIPDWDPRRQKGAGGTNQLQAICCVHHHHVSLLALGCICINMGRHHGSFCNRSSPCTSRNPISRVPPFAALHRQTWLLATCLSSSQLICRI